MKCTEGEGILLQFPISLGLLQCKNHQSRALARTLSTLSLLHMADLLSILEAVVQSSITLQIKFTPPPRDWDCKATLDPLFVLTLSFWFQSKETNLLNKNKNLGALVWPICNHQCGYLSTSKGQLVPLCFWHKILGFIQHVCSPWTGQLPIHPIQLPDCGRNSSRCCCLLSRISEWGNLIITGWTLGSGAYSAPFSGSPCSKNRLKILSCKGLDRCDRLSMFNNKIANKCSSKRRWERVWIKAI